VAFRSRLRRVDLDLAGGAVRVATHLHQYLEMPAINEQRWVGGARGACRPSRRPACCAVSAPAATQAPTALPCFIAGALLPPPQGQPHRYVYGYNSVFDEGNVQIGIAKAGWKPLHHRNMQRCA
jgi:hypothetical protein